MSISDIFSAKPEYAKKKHNEDNHLFRNLFERDRDRILYSKEFRRLNRKTQVFVSGFDDHVRNRLTHTIEVAQLSQTITSHLGLNETLVTAIAYGHDVGHTPFGHVGERTLNYFMNGCAKFRDFDKIQTQYRGFKHNHQGIRVVTDLERISSEFNGLNLTNYTLWGILNHTGVNAKDCPYRNKKSNSKCHYYHRNDLCINPDYGLSLSFYDKYLKQIDTYKSWTIEALIVRIADEIAQRHHDLEDGLFAKIIAKKEIIKVVISNFKELLNKKEEERLSVLAEENNQGIFIKSLSSLIINFLVTDLIENTKNNLLEIAKEFNLKNSSDFNRMKKNIYNKLDIFSIVSYSKELSNREKILQSFLKNRILNSNLAQSMDGKSTYILRRLIAAYLDNPQQLPDSTIYTLYMRLLKPFEKDNIKTNTYEYNIGYFRERLKEDHFKVNTLLYRNILMRTICDFIAGMTDDFAIMQYNKLYGTTNVFNNH